jgi:hypothetical protein
MNFSERVVYLSGGISGKPWWEVVEHFSRLETRLEYMGKIVCNPVKFPDKDSWEEYMKEGLRELVDSDCVVCLKGWKDSRGASFEHLVAKELDIPVYYEEEITWDF